MCALVGQIKDLKTENVCELFIGELRLNHVTNGNDAWICLLR